MPEKYFYNFRFVCSPGLNPATSTNQKLFFFFVIVWTPPFCVYPPYMDENGRVIRSLMNTMLVSRGMRLDDCRQDGGVRYLRSARGGASGEEDITDFARFIASLVASHELK